MNRLRLMLALLTLGMTGCHCLPITERWNDHVDAVADSECQMDCWHCPKLDVTRWGRWDGPRCCRSCR